MRIQFLCLSVLSSLTSITLAAPQPATTPSTQAALVEFRVTGFLPDTPICRARRPSPVVAVIENTGDVEATANQNLIVPRGVRVIDTDTPTPVRITPGDRKKLSWQIEADAAMSCELVLEVSAPSAAVAKASLKMSFLDAVESKKLPYIPQPRPVKTPLLVGAHHCPLWEADKPGMWANILKHPERTPALGFYAQENPEVADWETKWAVEHGVSFFVYCWYRTSQGGPVQTQFATAIHDALFKSKFVDKMRFTIMWENQSRGRAGVADENDLMTNLLPYWITNYFRHPSYVKIDNKPLLFIYRPEFLIDDLHGAENVSKAFAKMRQACRDAGFNGLYLLGEYRGLDPKHLRLMKQLGLDYTFAYCWYVGNSPKPDRAIAEQMQSITKTQELGIIPQIVTVSQGWSGWADEGSIWTIPPADYERLLQKAKDFVTTLPPDELGSKVLLLDNWNEWGEGHYIAPYREYGFGYLDAVRKVIAGDREPHLDLIPEDIGMGPYDTAFRTHLKQDEELRPMLAKRVHESGTPPKNLIAWWAFDEDDGNPITYDYAGHGLGGKLHRASRTQGIDGKALVCTGGGVKVENNPLLSPPGALTLECWVKTDKTGQDNKWFVNRVFGGGINCGYRLGVLAGKPCFEVPQTDWSHHLKADAPLPTGRWVHMAGTFNGKVMKIYVDGQCRGQMSRPGPINRSRFPLCLGTYELDHPAHFTGLLDEVKLYDRALSDAEIQAAYRKYAAPSPER